MVTEINVIHKSSKKIIGEKLYLSDQPNIKKIKTYAAKTEIPPNIPIMNFK